MATWAKGENRPWVAHQLVQGNVFVSEGMQHAIAHFPNFGELVMVLQRHMVTGTNTSTRSPVQYAHNHQGRSPC